MMSKKTMKIIVFIAMVLCIIAVSTLVLADAGFNATSLNGTASSASGDIQKLGNRIIGVLQAVGIVVSVVVVIVLVIVVSLSPVSISGVGMSGHLSKSFSRSILARYSRFLSASVLACPM